MQCLGISEELGGVKGVCVLEIFSIVINKLKTGWYARRILYGGEMEFRKSGVLKMIK